MCNDGMSFSSVIPDLGKYDESPVCEAVCSTVEIELEIAWVA